MSITAKELAAILEISRSTISMVYNDKKGISDATRRKVLQAAAEYGYEHVAKQSIYSQPAIIQYIVFIKHGYVVGDTDFFSNVLLGMDKEVRRYGYRFQLSYYYASDMSRKQFASIIDRQAQGIILLATEMEADDLELIEELKLPYVILDSSVNRDHSNCVIINNIQGAYHATSHLIQKGHRHIGHLSSKIHIHNFEERAEGFQSAIRFHSAIHEDISTTTVKVGSTTDSAYRDMCAYLSTQSHLPSAFFADNDIIASSCMKALIEFGYDVPNQVSIIGFDDVPLCGMLTPPLSTVHVPKESLGQIAIDLLDKQINKKFADCLKIEVGTRIIERKSVKAIQM